MSHHNRSDSASEAMHPSTSNSSTSGPAQPPFPVGVVDPDARSPAPSHPTAEALLNAAAKHVFPESERNEIPPPRAEGQQGPKDVTCEGRTEEDTESREEREEEPLIAGTPLDEMSPLQTPAVGTAGDGRGGGFPFTRQASWKDPGKRRGETGPGGTSGVPAKPHQLASSVIPEDSAAAAKSSGVDSREVGRLSRDDKAVRPGFGAGRELGSVRMGASALMSALNSLPWEEDDGHSSDGSSSDDEAVTQRTRPAGGTAPARPKISRLGSSLHTIHANESTQATPGQATSPTTPRYGQTSLQYPSRQDAVGTGVSEPNQQLPAVAELIAGERESESRRSSLDSNAGSNSSLPPQARLALNEQISHEQDMAGEEEEKEMYNIAESSSDLPEGDDSREDSPSDRNTAAALHEAEGSDEIIEDRMGSVPSEKQRVRREKLGEKLMQVFGLQEREEVLDEMRCWLLRSVMLKGYMYLTARHICFFAHMPDRENVVVKSGPLTKKASRTKLTSKYWVVIRNDVLSWYESTSDPYFPKGNISLQYISSCDAVDDHRFKLRGPERNWTFSAETESARDEWVKVIQKVMFKTQHEGENIKLVIPLEAVLEVEKSPTLEFAETIEIRCVDPEDQMSVDSYFFASFTNTDRTLRTIQRLIDNRPIDRLPRRSSEYEYEDVSEGESLQRKKSGTDKSVMRSASAGLRKVGSVLRPLVSRNVDKDHSDSSSTLVDDDKDKEKRTSILGLKLSSKQRGSDETLHGGDASHGLADEDEYEGYPPRQSGQPPAQGEKGWSSWIKKPVSKVLGSSASSSSLSRTTSPQSTLSRPDRSANQSLHKSSYLAPSDPQLGEPERVREVVESMIPNSGSDADSSDNEDENGRARRRGGSKGSAARQPRHSFSSAASAGSGLGRSEYAVVEDDGEEDETAKKFRSVFTLPDKEELIDHFPGYLYRVLPVSGRFFVSTNYFCFRSSQLLYKTKMIIPIRDLFGLKAQKAFRFDHSGLCVVIKGHEEVFLEFSSSSRRKACVRILEERMEAVRVASPDAALDTEYDASRIEMRIMEDLDESAPLNERAPAPTSPSPMFGSTTSTFLEFKPEPMRVTCLTIGSRGDVQPYIALCKGLQAEGHTTKIATHGEYKDWVEGHGIGFASVGGDPAELMQMCVDNGMFTISFMKEGLQKFRGWLDDLLMSSWDACQDSDLLIESPSAMGGVHIAEALQIPYFRAFTMPWTRTRAYPHAFAVPEHKKGGAYNYMTYTMFDQVFWRAISGQVNRWRRKVMHIEPTTFEKLEQHKIPFLYNFSPGVVPPPLDWTEWIHVTGYWFLENADESAAKSKEYTPPEGLLDFIHTAHSKGKKIVYIGFGSIVVSDPEEMTRCVVDAVVEADVYAILSKGWSDRGSKAKEEDEDSKEGADGVKYPPNIFPIDSIDHSWLFTRIDAACHHGGAGTTGASLRAGIPTIIKPFFGDQAFWSERVESLNVGSAVRKLTSEALAEALRKATTDEKQIAKAKVVGEIIRKENGVVRAIEAIYRDLEYAKSQIKPPPSDSSGGIPLGKVTSLLSTRSRDSDSGSKSSLSLARTNSPKKRETDRHKPRTSSSGAHSGTASRRPSALSQQIEEEEGSRSQPELGAGSAVREESTEREREQGSDGSWSVVSGEGRSRAASDSAAHILDSEVDAQHTAGAPGGPAMVLGAPLDQAPAR